MVARRICDLLASDAERPALSVSIGIASHPKDAETIGTLLYAADRALYAMKDKRSRSAQARLTTIDDENDSERRKSNG